MMQKMYHELVVTIEPTMVEIVADFVSALSSEAVEFNQREVILRSETDLTYVKEELVGLAHSLEGVEFTIELTQKENEDWIKRYQNAIDPIEVGRFYVSPSWHDEKEGCINIKIDPALAFGSGHHATTYTCLKVLDKIVVENMKVLDVGCGSGILALAASKQGAVVDLCDTDEQSIMSSKENFTLNNAQYRQIWQGSVQKATEQYDIVIANIIADVLVMLADNLKEACKKHGSIILSGILNTKEERVREAFSDLTLKERFLKDEWITLVYTKDVN
jgi:ribosomal protein L11 methyltransferase